ncbi:CIA30 family protein [Prochlorococcus sp. MIT 1307]|uniref:CIA30 family protein n=1 Tax=Prochlorococcus sp. MIT 1307 TaxID=3096219 RepID=UPI002A75B978|nr:CIA30 family protein [Prochlorococcus sp. MIT 1307]
MSRNLIIASYKDFGNWIALNDTIMGGSSEATCKLTSQGLVLDGKLIEEGGGFVSCQSPLYKPTLNLSGFCGFQLQLDGQGRTLKFAVACKGSFLGYKSFFGSGLRWVSTFPTKPEGKTIIQIPFNKLKPTIRAKRVIPFTKFDPSSIYQIQLLYSKFGLPGEMNPGFKSGPIHLLLREVSSYA